jgi:hypothetical protein
MLRIPVSNLEYTFFKMLHYIAVEGQTQPLTEFINGLNLEGLRSGLEINFILKCQLGPGYSCLHL